MLTATPYSPAARIMTSMMIGSEDTEKTDAKATHIRVTRRVELVLADKLLEVDSIAHAPAAVAFKLPLCGPAGPLLGPTCKTNSGRLLMMQQFVNV